MYLARSFESKEDKANVYMNAVESISNEELITLGSCSHTFPISTAVLREVNQGTAVGLTTALGDLSGIVSVRVPRLHE